jgi:DNA repair/transcription protein MET18/MMS19
VLQRKPERGKEDTKAYFARLVAPLLTKTIVPLVGSSEDFGDSKIMAEDSVLDITGRLLNTIIRSLDSDEQKAVIEQAFNIFIRGEPSDYIPETYRTSVADEFRPLSKSEHAGCVILFAYILAGLRREVWVTPSDALA